MRGIAAIAAGLASLAGGIATAHAEAFDATHCYFGTATVLFASDDAVIASFEHKGIYRGNNGNKTLEGYSIQCAGVTKVINKKRTSAGGCKILDPKGDAIALVFEGAGPPGGESGTADAVGGSGAWKGVTGGGKWQVHTASKPLVPGTFQGCLRYHGAFTVPK